MQELEGGREGIYKRDNTVIRPLHGCSESIHALLNHYHNNGFTQCPAFVGIEGENEIVTFVEGAVSDYPLEGPIGSETALVSAAKLLRKMHESSKNFLAEHGEMNWLLPPREPQEVIAHGDYAPYNAALVGNEVVGIFDFDVSHPAPRIWDIAFAVYTWAPFMTDPGCVKGTLRDQIARANLFMESYGISDRDRAKLVPTMISRVEYIVEFMTSEAEKGNEKFRKDVEAGHHNCYLKDISYLKENAETIQRGIIADTMKGSKR